MKTGVNKQGFTRSVVISKLLHSHPWIIMIWENLSGALQILAMKANKHIKTFQSRRECFYLKFGYSQIKSYYMYQIHGRSLKLNSLLSNGFFQILTHKGWNPGWNPLKGLVVKVLFFLEWIRRMDCLELKP